MLVEVLVAVGVSVGAGVLVEVGVFVGAGVLVEVGVLVGAGVLVEVLVAVGVSVGAGVLVAVGVGVLVGITTLIGSQSLPDLIPVDVAPAKVKETRTVALPPPTAFNVKFWGTFQLSVVNVKVVFGRWIMFGSELERFTVPANPALSLIVNVKDWPLLGLATMPDG